VIQQQLYTSEQTVRLARYSHCLLQHSVQHYRKPASLSAPAFTFIHFLISSDLSMQLILPLERNLDAEKILSTDACDADAASRSWATDASLSKTA